MLAKLKSYTPDILSLSGLLILGYGLYLFERWVSFSVVGALLMMAGLRAGRGE